MSADTIVPHPSDPQSLNRFSFVRNNPLKYVDPSGHCFTLNAFGLSISLFCKGQEGNQPTIVDGDPDSFGGENDLTIYDGPGSFGNDDGVQILDGDPGSFSNDGRPQILDGDPGSFGKDSAAQIFDGNPDSFGSLENRKPQIIFSKKGRPEDVADEVSDYDRSAYGDYDDYDKTFEEVATRDNFTCQLCGKRGGDLQLDHEPSLYYHWYYEGGWKMTDEDRNKWYQDPSKLQCAHTRCNQSAGTKL